MSAAHTPGPWRAAGEHVFSVNGRLTVTYANYGTENERIANARLIAAAPALLEALEDARTSLSITRTNIMCEIGRCADPSESRWAGVPEQLAKRIAKIDAAISLAKGESA